MHKNKCSKGNLIIKYVYVVDILDYGLDIDCAVFLLCNVATCIKIAY